MREKNVPRIQDKNSLYKKKKIDKYNIFWYGILFNIVCL